MKKKFTINLFLPATLFFFSNTQLSAQIMCTDIIPDSVVSIAPGATMQFTTDLDINNDAIMDFRISMVQSGSFGFVNVQAGQIATVNAVMANGSNTALALPLNTPITPTSTTWVQMNGSNQQMGIFAAGPPGGSYPGMGDRYLGVRFIVGPSTYYGWVRFNFSNAVNSYTVKDYGYNATPNASIAAGALCAPVFVPTFSIASPMCAGNSQIVTANTGSFVASGYTWTATPAGPVFGAPNASVTSITFSTAGTYSVTLSATSGTASGSQTNTILINPKPTLSVVTTNTLLCGGQTATISASGAASYSWSNGALTASTAVSPSLTTNYTVTGTSAAGCSNSAVFTQSVCMQTAYNKMLVKDTTTWQHFSIIFGVKSAQNESVLHNSLAAIDTITIAGNKYKKLYYLSTPAYLNYTNKFLWGYIREDSAARKIYYKESVASPEFVLYNFALNVGDSTQLTFPNAASYNGYYRVDSIVTKTEMCGPRKHFYLRKHVNNPDQNLNYYEFIESIGSTLHLLYRYNNGLIQPFIIFPNGCNHDWSVGLACKHNMNIQQYQSCTFQAGNWTNYYNSCNYYYFTSGLKNHAKINGFAVYPNPSNNKTNLNFSLDGNEVLSIKVVDVLGKLFIHHQNISFNAGENKFELNTSVLENGVYTIEIENNGAKSSHPIIIHN